MYSEYASENIPQDELYFIRYVQEHQRKSSNIHLIGPNGVAGYLKIIEHYWDPKRGKNNLVPIEMIPFPIISQRELNFFNKLVNNILIYDSTLKAKEKFRKLHMDELSTLIARSINILGEEPRETMYASLQRDGKVKNKIHLEKLATLS